MPKLALLPVLILLAVPASAQERRAMTTDGLDMVRVGGATISPDGSWVLAEEGGSRFRFSADGSKKVIS